MSSSRRPRHAALAVLLTVIAAVAALAAVALPVKIGIDARAVAAGVQADLDTVRRSIREGNGLPGASERGLIIRDRSSGRASARLQDVVSGSARSHGVVVRSLQVVDPVEASVPAPIEIEVAGQASLASLLGLLTELESGLPVLIVSEMAVRKSEGGQSKDGDMLDIRVKVRGFTILGDGS